MGLMRKTAIVIPCYNEAERLNAKAFLDMSGKEPGLHFIFVNDGSTDSTPGMLRSMCGKDPEKMSVLEMTQNSGKAEAVRRGVLKGIEGGYSNVGYWDADLAAPLSAIPEFCALLDSSSTTVAIGSRVRLLGRRIERKITRHFLGRVFATFASLILEIPVYDTQCGAKVFKNTVRLKAAFSVPFRVRWTFDVELLARLSIIEKAAGNTKPEGSWVECPLKEWEDVAGSKIRTGDFIRGGLELFRIFAFLHLPVVRRRYAARLTNA